MAISIRAAGTANSGTAAFTLTLPTHVADDIIVIGVVIGGADVVSSVTAGASGLTALGYAQYGSTQPDAASATEQMLVFWKRATSSSETNPVIGDGGNHQVAQAVSISGCVRSGSPWVGSATQSYVATTTACSIPNASTAINGSLVLSFVSSSQDTGTTQFSAPVNAALTFVALTLNANTLSGTGGGFGLITGIKTTAGAVSNSTCTAANSNPRAYLSGALIPEQIILANAPNILADIVSSAPKSKLDITAQIVAENLLAPQHAHMTSVVGLSGIDASIALDSSTVLNGTSLKVTDTTTTGYPTAQIDAHIPTITNYNYVAQGKFFVPGSGTKTVTITVRWYEEDGLGGYYLESKDVNATIQMGTWTRISGDVSHIGITGKVYWCVIRVMMASLTIGEVFYVDELELSRGTDTALPWSLPVANHSVEAISTAPPMSTTKFEGPWQAGGNWWTSYTPDNNHSFQWSMKWEREPVGIGWFNSAQFWFHLVGGATDGVTYVGPQTDTTTGRKIIVFAVWGGTSYVLGTGPNEALVPTWGVYNPELEGAAGCSIRFDWDWTTDEVMTFNMSTDGAGHITAKVKGDKHGNVWYTIGTVTGIGNGMAASPDADKPWGLFSSGYVNFQEMFWDSYGPAHAYSFGKTVVSFFDLHANIETTDDRPISNTIGAHIGDPPPYVPSSFVITGSLPDQTITTTYGILGPDIVLSEPKVAAQANPMTVIINQSIAAGLASAVGTANRMSVDRPTIMAGLPNLLPAGIADGSDITGLVPTSCTVSVSEDQSVWGNSSLKLTPTAGSPNVIFTEVAIIPNALYAASANWRSSTAKVVGINIRWYDSGHTYISTDGPTASNILTANVWNALIADSFVQAPSNAAYARVQILVTSATIGVAHYIDKLSLTIATENYNPSEGYWSPGGAGGIASAETAAYRNNAKILSTPASLSATIAAYNPTITAGVPAVVVNAETNVINVVVSVSAVNINEISLSTTIAFGAYSPTVKIQASANTATINNVANVGNASTKANAGTSSITTTVSQQSINTVANAGMGSITTAISQQSTSTKANAGTSSITTTVSQQSINTVANAGTGVISVTISQQSTSTKANAETSTLSTVALQSITNTKANAGTGVITTTLSQQSINTKTNAETATLSTVAFQSITSTKANAGTNIITTAISQQNINSKANAETNIISIITPQLITSAKASSGLASVSIVSAQSRNDISFNAETTIFSIISNNVSSFASSAHPVEVDILTFSIGAYTPSIVINFNASLATISTVAAQSSIGIQSRAEQTSISTVVLPSSIGIQSTAEQTSISTVVMQSSIGIQSHAEQISISTIALQSSIGIQSNAEETSISTVALQSRNDISFNAELAIFTFISNNVSSFATSSVNVEVDILTFSIDAYIPSIIIETNSEFASVSTSSNNIEKSIINSNANLALISIFAERVIFIKPGLEFMGIIPIK